MTQAVLPAVVPPMRARRTRWWLLASLLAAAVLLYLAFTAWSKHSAISTACEWARLAPLPDPKDHLTVDVQGSMFTRTFVITFHADAATIQRWLAASPGFADAHIETTGPLR